MSDRRAVEAFERCGTCPVHNSSICTALGADRVSKLGIKSKRRQLAAGAVIASEGEPSRHVHNVVSGMIGLSKMLPDGRQQIVGILHPSDFFGCAFAKSCDVTAEALTEVELCSVERGAFEALLRENPEFEHAFLEHVIHELHVAREWLLVLGCKTGLERVASFLWLLVSRGERQGCPRATPTEAPRVYTIPLSRAVISRYLGLSLETVSRQISQLNAMGAIRLSDPRHFTVPDPEELRDLSGISSESV